MTEPAPSADELQAIYRAALRAPDHAWLRPWRFLTVAGERREALGQLLEECLVARNPDADEAARSKARAAPLRAPLLVVAIAHITEHPKVPPVEQRLSTGCVSQGLLLGAEALGYAGIWRTGDAAFDRRVMDGLGLAANEEIMGFLYIGSRDGRVKPIPELDPADYFQAW